MTSVLRKYKQAATLSLSSSSSLALANKEQFFPQIDQSMRWIYQRIYQVYYTMDASLQQWAQTLKQYKIKRQQQRRQRIGYRQSATTTTTTMKKKPKKGLQKWSVAQTTSPYSTSTMKK
jgi:cell shape-determining protein MreC